MNSHEVFIHIQQGCFAGTGAIVRLPQCQWSKPDGYGKISQFITTTKQSKAKNVCIFLGIYCTYPCFNTASTVVKLNRHTFRLAHVRIRPRTCIFFYFRSVPGMYLAVRRYKLFCRLYGVMNFAPAMKSLWGLNPTQSFFFCTWPIFIYLLTHLIFVCLLAFVNKWNVLNCC